MQPHYGKYSCENANPAAHPQHIPISLLHVRPPPPLQGMVKDNQPNHNCIDIPIW